MQTNILVQYQGGGYDGCFWEWNYFYVDKQEEFHDVFSSGRAGITNKEDGQALFDNDTDDVSVYYMSKEEDIKSFVTENNLVCIKGVFQWFDNWNDLDIEFFVICSGCEQKIKDYDEIVLENWHGCGGIVSTADELLCQECYAMGICGCCDEYVGTDDLTYLGGEYGFDDDYMNQAARKMLDDGYSDVCGGCIEEQARQLEEDEHQDLLFASLATGKPDMFSDKMRWFWGG